MFYNDNLENGMVLGNDESETVSQEDYEYHQQDDWRKEQQIQEMLEKEDD